MSHWIYTLTVFDRTDVAVRTYRGQVRADCNKTALIYAWADFHSLEIPTPVSPDIVELEEVLDDICSEMRFARGDKKYFSLAGFRECSDYDSNYLMHVEERGSRLSKLDLMSDTDMREALQEIVEALYPDGDTDQEWDADTMQEVADVLQNHELVPDAQ